MAISMLVVMPDDIAVGRQVQAVRLARNLTQKDVAERAGLSTTTVSRIENGDIEGATVRTLRSLSRALKMPSLAFLGWRGPEVERLLDAAHAAIVEAMVRRLSGSSWRVWAEHSFSEFGERGSIDILAWHPAARTLVSVEVKSRLWNIQDTLMTMDRKLRLSRVLAARDLGVQPIHFGLLLVLPETRAQRACVQRHRSIFEAALPNRQVAVRRWLDAPDSDLRGLLFLHISREALVRQRVRRKLRRVVPRTGLR